MRKPVIRHYKNPWVWLGVAVLLGAISFGVRQLIVTGIFASTSDPAVVQQLTEANNNLQSLVAQSAITTPGATNKSTSSATVALIVDAAKARAALMSSAMEVSPQAVISNSLPAATLAGLPSDAKKFVEVNVKTSGKVYESVVEDFTTEPRTTYSFVDVTSGTPYGIYYQKQVVLRDLAKSQQVTQVSGVSLMGKIAVSNIGSGILSSLASPALAATVVNAPTIKKVAVIVASQGPPARSASATKKVVFNDAGSLFPFRIQGMNEPTGDVFGEYALDASKVTGPCPYQALATQAWDQAKLNPNFVTTGYDNYIFVMSSSILENTCGYVGIADVGGNFAYIFDKADYKADKLAHIVGHEMGHNYGLRHAEAMLDNGSLTSNYGDAHDLMGSLGEYFTGFAYDYLRKPNASWATDISVSGAYEMGEGQVFRIPIQHPRWKFLYLQLQDNRIMVRYTVDPFGYPPEQTYVRVYGNQQGIALGTSQDEHFGSDIVSIANTSISRPRYEGLITATISVAFRDGKKAVITGYGPSHGGPVNGNNIIFIDGYDLTKYVNKIEFVGVGSVSVEDYSFVASAGMSKLKVIVPKSSSAREVDIVAIQKNGMRIPIGRYNYSYSAPIIDSITPSSVSACDSHAINNIVVSGNWGAIAPQVLSIVHDVSAGQVGAVNKADYLKRSWTKAISTNSFRIAPNPEYGNRVTDIFLVSDDSARLGTVLERGIVMRDNFIMSVTPNRAKVGDKVSVRVCSAEFGWKVTTWNGISGDVTGELYFKTQPYEKLQLTHPFYINIKGTDYNYGDEVVSIPDINDAYKYFPLDMVVRFVSLEEPGKTLDETVLADAFSYLGTSFLLPTKLLSEQSGAPLVIEGSQFGSRQGTVRFDGINANLLYWSDTSVVAIIPTKVVSSPTSVSVVLSPVSGSANTPTAFTYYPRPAVGQPFIRKTTPVFSKSGTVSMDIEGEGFGTTAGSVTMSGAFGIGTANLPDVKIISWTSTKIKVTFAAPKVTRAVSALVTVAPKGSSSMWGMFGLGNVASATIPFVYLPATTPTTVPASPVAGSGGGIGLPTVNLDGGLPNLKLK